MGGLMGVVGRGGLASNRCCFCCSARQPCAAPCSPRVPRPCCDTLVQVIGQALGGKTFKLKFGHHGGNHPLRHTPTGEAGEGMVRVGWVGGAHHFCRSAPGGCGAAVSAPLPSSTLPSLAHRAASPALHHHPA